MSDEQAIRYSRPAQVIRMDAFDDWALACGDERALAVVNRKFDLGLAQISAEVDEMFGGRRFADLSEEERDRFSALYMAAITERFPDFQRRMAEARERAKRENHAAAQRELSRCETQDQRRKVAGEHRQRRAAGRRVERRGLRPVLELAAEFRRFGREPRVSAGADSPPTRSRMGSPPVRVPRVRPRGHRPTRRIRTKRSGSRGDPSEPEPPPARVLRHRGWLIRRGGHRG